MPFPALRPTSRDFKPGDYPVKTYSAQSGAEVRILYGDTRTRMELSLGYDNATDAQAKQFLDHYDEVKGSFSTFEVDPSARAGWGSTAEAIDTAGVNRWRYADSPQVTAVRPGRSSIRVNLVGVF
jgi:hypothetical protein